LDRGADPNATDVNRETPLFYARSGDADTVTLLLKRGAHPDARNVDDQTALQIAADNGDLLVAKALADAGADVNARPSARATAWTEDPGHWPLLREPEGTRPLYAAVCSGSTKLVDLLLNAGAEIDALSFGWSALHAAAAMPDTAMVEFLLSHGADLFVKSADGRTPIEMLAGHRRAAELLRNTTTRRA
jgi:ankyrin repeat protein